MIVQKSFLFTIWLLKKHFLCICLILFCKDEGDEGLNEHEDGNGSKDNLREQDIYLPIANVARIMKIAIPQTGKVSNF